MVLCTFFAAGVCIQYFQSYNWGFMGSALFGSIISATDPVAVVAILRELGLWLKNSNFHELLLTIL